MSIYPKPGNMRPVDPVLSGFVAGVANQPSNFVADEILPVIVNSTSATNGDDSFSTGTLQRFADAALFGDPSANDVVAPGQTYPRDRGGDFNPLTFACQKYGREAVLLWEELKRLQGAGKLGAEMAKLLPLVQTLLIRKEVRVAEFFESITNWTNYETLTDSWDEDAGDINGDIITAMESVMSYGMTANTMVLPRDSFVAMVQNNSFLEFLNVDRDRTTLYAPGALAEVLAGRYGIDRLILANASYNTDKDPDAAPTLDYVWGDTCWIGYLPPAPQSAVMPSATGVGTSVQLLTPMAGARIVEHDWEVQTYPEEQSDSDIYKVRYSEIDKVVSPGLGFLLKNTIA